MSYKKSEIRDFTGCSKHSQKYMIAVRKEEYGYRCLTNEKQFYLENYPDIVIEKSGIDELILMEKKEK